MRSVRLWLGTLPHRRSALSSTYRADNGVASVRHTQPSSLITNQNYGTAPINRCDPHDRLSERVTKGGRLARARFVT
jgi:hypothetical protein